MLLKWHVMAWQEGSRGGDMEHEQDKLDNTTVYQNGMSGQEGRRGGDLEHEQACPGSGAAQGLH